MAVFDGSLAVFGCKRPQIPSARILVVGLFRFNLSLVSARKKMSVHLGQLYFRVNSVFSLFMLEFAGFLD